MRLGFVAREVMRPLLEGHPLIDRFFALGQGTRALARQFSEAKPAGIVHCHPDSVCQIAAWVTGIGRRIGYKASWRTDWTLNTRFPDRRLEGRQHEALAQFDLLAPLGVTAPPLESLQPSVHLAERWRETLQARMGGKTGGAYLVLNPTAHSLTHRWPAAHFAWLARELQGAFERTFLVGQDAGDPSVAALRTALEGSLPGFADLSGKLNLAELGWLLRGARLLVTRNTGTSHLAAAVDCPTVELFGRLEPAYGPNRWRALGARFEIVTPLPGIARARNESKRAFWERSYREIPREAVLAACRRLL